MIPSYWAIRARTNADFAETFTFESPVGSPDDVTSWVSSMQIRDDVGGTLIADIVAQGAFVNGGAAGTITPQLAESVMRTLAPGVYVFDYRATTGGTIVGWLAGPFVIEGGVTTP